MPSLQELERPIDEAIANALIGVTPETWRLARLEVTRSDKANGVQGFEHVITSPEGHRDIVQADDKMFELTFKLADLFEKFGKPWKKVIYTVSQVPSSPWF